MLTFGRRTRPSADTATEPSWAGVSTFALGHTLLAQARVAPQLLPYHLLALTTTGHGTVEVDFQARDCRPGTLLWIRPGRAVRFGGQPGLDAALITWERDLLPAAQLAGLDVDDPTGATRW